MLVTQLIGQVNAVFDRARAMSDDILLGSKLRAGAVNVKPVAINGTELVAAVVGRYLLSAAQSQVGLTLDCDELVDLVADPAQLDRALANLIQNAIDYTKDSERRLVTVSLSSTPQHVVVHVADSGLGIEAADLDRIGQRFVRLTSGVEHHHGNGLGLFGVAMIADLHAGTIEIASEGRDQGTTVTLRLPRALSPALVEGAGSPGLARCAA